MPDGFLDVPTSVGTAVVAAGGVALALRRARTELDDRAAPLAGLVAVFIFAAQLITFPVGAGTSGHLLGGALAAILVGPWTATLAMTVVITVQALLFSDGGITALGTNLTLMGLVGVWVGWLAFVGARALLPRTRPGLVASTAVAAFVSVVATALAFVGLYAVGGAAPIPLDRLTVVMLTWHALIGLGEALITALAVSSIAAARPDLVHGFARPTPAPTPTEVVA